MASHKSVTRADAHPPGEVTDYMDLAEVAAPSTPASGKVRLYAKSDGNLYQKDDAGTETGLAGGGGGGAPTTAKYLTTASDGTLSAEVVIPGLAGSPDIAGAAGGGFAKEYDSGSSGLTWGSAPAVEDVNTTILSHLYLKSTATGENLGTEAWAPAGAFDIRAKVMLGTDITATQYASIGLHVGASSNTSRLLILVTTDLANLRTTVAGHTYASGSYTQRGSTFLNAPLNGPLYLRATRDGSNNCSLYFSTNGLLWQLIATQSITFTVANRGFRLDQGSATASYYAVDWLRGDV